MGVYLSQPNTKKTTDSGSASGIRWASCEMQGWRKNMEDARICKVNVECNQNKYQIFGVFDGHGGTQVSKFVQAHFVEQLIKLPEFQSGKIEQALELNFRNMDVLLETPEGRKELFQIKKNLSNDTYSSYDQSTNINAGCTANVLVIDDKKFYIANAGDSRCALLRDGNLVVLSEDHKPQSQIQKTRIQSAGGYIMNGRVNGGLNLTRAIGDFEYKRASNLDYKQQMITCHPDIITIQRKKDKDDFILMGCDGIWQKYVNDSKGLLDLVKQKRSKQNNLEKLLEDLLDQLLAKNTMEEVGCDNMTSVIIEFEK